MRILYHHRIASKDGQAVHMQELITALRNRGHEVLEIGPPSTKRHEFGGQVKAFALLKTILPAACYELLELFYSIPSYFRLRGACIRFGPDVLYERANLFLLSGFWVKRTQKLPMILEVNAPLAMERKKFGSLALSRLAQICEECVWRNADFVLPVSHSLAAILRQSGISDNRIGVIPNGIDRRSLLKTVDHESAKKRLGLSDKLVLGFAGFVREWHGVEQVVDILAANIDRSDLHLLIVGDGPARKTIEERAAMVGIVERVTVTGVVGRNRIMDYVSAFDIALQPRVTPYASPLKLFEYMALGRAIIAPRTPNIEEILTNGETALLFDPDDSGSLTACLRRLCDDVDLRQRLGQAARQSAIEHDYTWQKNAQAVEEVIEKLVPQKPEGPN